MFRSLALALLLAPSLLAQTTIDAGAALGRQSYESRADDPKDLLSIEALGMRRSAGIHLAVDVADLSQEGRVTIVHPDLVYRWSLPMGFGLMIGGGPSWAQHGGAGAPLTWNAELEASKRLGPATIFARVRQYDYGIPRFREGEAGPSGPAVYAGVRFRISG